jgi:DNA invertase Pin-like site-specific DNA recombinase
MKLHYIRISTSGQNADRQVEQVEKGWIAVKDETSGSVPFVDRSGGAKVMREAESGKLKELKVHSIDRLGRSTIDVLNTIQKLTEYGVNVISHKEGLQTLIDGKENPTAKLVIGILATVSELERNMMLERQREGIQQAKKRGAYKGRPKGTKEDPKEFLAKHKAVQKVIKQGLSIRNAAKLTGVSINTVRKVKTYMD